MVYRNTIIEGNVKFRDGKKWKTRWCVMRKLSPVADCLHLQLYRDSKDHYRHGQTKASLSLQHFLALETGFTLDKESNTMAIICQDVTVVLAFDSRELLIQWQVKVAKNLGEDHQVLVQVASAPARSKISPGPAHLHIKEYKFCLTSGLPPRLLGFWEISQLRKYGVVDGRFCFEGGSQCGRSEGLFVLVTNQGDDIAQTLQLAAEGKPVCNKRPFSRNTSVLESPRRSNHWRAESHLGGVESHLHQSCAELTTQPILHSSHVHYGSDNYPWLSSETRPDSSDFGDSISSVDHSHISYLDWHDGNQDVCSNFTPESCSSSCNTAAHKSRMSSCCNHALKNSLHQLQMVPVQGETASKEQFPWNKELGNETCECCLGGHRSNHSLFGSPSHTRKYCHGLHGAVPDTQQEGYSCTEQTLALGLGNYDIPRSAKHVLKESGKYFKENQIPPSDLLEENYDTPRSVKEKTESLLPQHQYSNYDTPQSVHHHVQHPPPVKAHCSRVVMDHDDCKLLLCPCQRIFGWIPLPYCYRGYGIENTGTKFCKVQLLDEKCQTIKSQNSAPPKKGDAVEPAKKDNAETENLVFQPTRNSALEYQSYLGTSTVSTKCNPRNSSCEGKILSENNCSNSIQVNYANMEFADSLEFYENARDLIKRTEVKNELSSSVTECSSNSEEKCLVLPKNIDKKQLFCSKCTHECNNTGEAEKTKLNQENETVIQDDYTFMYPDEFSPKKKCNSGEALDPCKLQKGGNTEYLHMSPLTNSPLKKKILASLDESFSKSVNSIPCYFNCNKDELKPMRVPGKAVLCIEESSVAINSYVRRNFRFFKEEHHLSPQLTRRRSNSIDCASYSDENLYNYFKFRRERNDSKQRITNPVDKHFVNCSSFSQTLPFLPPTLRNKIERDHCEYTEGKENCERKEKSKYFCDNSCNNVLNSSSPVHVRRSCSVPCKPGNNRDSSSSNDSGVSTGSPKFQTEFEQMPSLEMNVQSISSQGNCLHFSLPRKSKNTDPLQELSFQFQTIKSATELEESVPVENKESLKGYSSSNTMVMTHDSRSTSSATSDMSDYIETLSLSSYSSSDTPENLRLNRSAVIMLKPRSGKEYHKVDRCILDMDSKKSNDLVNTVVPEKAKSPSPGYSSGSPLN